MIERDEWKVLAFPGVLIALFVLGIFGLLAYRQWGERVVDRENGLGGRLGALDLEADDKNKAEYAAEVDAAMDLWRAGKSQTVIDLCKVKDTHEERMACFRRLR